MKKNKIIFCIIMLAMSLNVHALEKCSNEEMARLKELANNVDFTYNYVINDEGNLDELSYESVYYKVTVSNWDNDLKLYYKYADEKDYDEISIDELNNTEFPNDATLVFAIRAYVANMCANELLKTKTLDLPYYNIYYYINKSKCDEYPDFKYCKEIMTKSPEKENEEIDDLFNKYIEKNNQTVEEKTNENVQNQGISWTIIAGFILIIIVIIIIAYFYFKKVLAKKKNEI